MKRRICVLLALLLTLWLTACGKAPTPDELLAAADRTAGEGTLEMSLVYTNTDQSLTFGLEMEAQTAFNQAVSHTEGTLALFLNGLSYAIKSDTYTDLEKGISYDYDKDSKSWKSKEIDPAKNNNLDLSGLKPEDFDSLLLAEHSKGDPYRLQGALDVGKLMSALGAGDVAESAGISENTEGIKAELTYTFQEKTRKLEKIEAHSVLTEDGEVGNFKMDVTYTVTADSSDVAIPPEVLE